MDFKFLLQQACIQATNGQKNKMPEHLITQAYSTPYLKSSFPFLQAYGDLDNHTAFSCSFHGLPVAILFYTVSGRGTINQMEVSEHTLVFQDSNTPFSLSSHEEFWKLQILFLTGDSLSTYFELSHAKDRIFPIRPASSIPERIKQLVQYNFISGKAEALLAAHHLNEILTELTLEGLNQENPENEFPAYILAFRRELCQNLDQPFSLSYYENKLKISKYRLCREFSIYFGISPLQYLLQLRIDHAKDLLLSTDLTIREVGSAVGIDNTTHFIQLFHKKTGATPFAYKQAASASIRALHYPYLPDAPVK